MTKIFSHIIPKIEDWPVARQARERSTFIQRLNEFVMTQVMATHANNLSELISKTIYLESQRVKLTPWKVDPIDDTSYWRRLAGELEAASQSNDKKAIEEQIVKRIVNRYNEEIVGSFNPRTFRIIRTVLNSFFKRLLNGYFIGGQWRWGSKKALQQRIILQGDVEKIRELFLKGTVVIMPTHYSNLDSIMVGYGIDTNVGLPCFSYGAGLNLFNYELIAYLMNRMGPFRLDRRKKNPIYLECLKSFTSYSVYEGMNCIFFPGGTRSRSGETEEKLKLGLINSLIEAQRMYLEEGQGKKIYVIPVNIGYHFVLEANSLIDQHLQLIGREKYIKSRPAGPSMISISRFFKDLYTKQSEVYLSFGEPMDVLGNIVNQNGESTDKFGQPVDINEYFSWEGKIGANTQREGVYAKKLGERVVESYKKHNTVLSSNIVTFVAFNMIYEDFKEMGLIAFVNQKGKKYVIDFDNFRSRAFEIIEIIKQKAEDGEMLLSEESWDNSDMLINEGLSKVGIYHMSRAIEKTKDGKIICKNIKLLYFYHNRLTNYRLEEEMGWQKV
jgi:glycerol-3-phosphate O-acyltransferase